MQPALHCTQHLLVELYLLLEENLVGGLDVHHPLLVEGVHLIWSNGSKGSRKGAEDSNEQGPGSRAVFCSAHLRQHGVGDVIRPLPDPHGLGRGVPVHLSPLTLGPLQEQQGVSM